MANTKKPELKEPGPSDNQLIDFKKSHKTEQLTTGYGRPLGERSTVITVGPRGPLLLSDFPYIEDTQRFDRERIPERVVHAKGLVTTLLYSSSWAFTKAIVLNGDNQNSRTFCSNDMIGTTDSKFRFSSC
ncbi:unnamed protein product [Adineta steineri]|uniref:Catalase core domain-containing protein n=1 Tax=Adineta steineri TaxID=433720 RepID=A0A813SXM0_9BILA|nr:unnamed protein product [Adineta steineri]